MPRKRTGIAMFSRARLDTLSDGIFGVAITLLILDVRLPDDFHPRDGAELLSGLIQLMSYRCAIREVRVGIDMGCLTGC
jgi:uncharacterized membrane protein